MPTAEIFYLPMATFAITMAFLAVELVNTRRSQKAVRVKRDV